MICLTDSVPQLQEYKLQLLMRQQLGLAAYRSKVLEQTYGCRPTADLSLLPSSDGYMTVVDKVKGTI
jgi:hypothetical protein